MDGTTEDRVPCGNAVLRSETGAFVHRSVLFAKAPHHDEQMCAVVGRGMAEEVPSTLGMDADLLRTVGRIVEAVLDRPAGRRNVFGAEIHLWPNGLNHRWHEVMASPRSLQDIQAAAVAVNRHRLTAAQFRDVEAKAPIAVHAVLAHPRPPVLVAFGSKFRLIQLLFFEKLRCWNFIESPPHQK
jgi:hypothetical protein